MKKLLYSLSLAVLALAAPLASQAQSVGIGTGASAPDASAALEVKSTTQGMLVPRMTQGQRGLIATPATGLMVYQTDGTAGFYFYNGTAWTNLSGGTTLPSQTGNSGKVLTTDGTTTSWTSYNKEQLTVYRLPASGAATWTVPAFTNGVSTQIIVITGAWSATTPAVGTQTIVIPDPATVPDGSRIIVKRMDRSGFDAGTTAAAIKASIGPWPVTSGLDGRFPLSATATYSFDLDSNLDGTGNQYRHAIELMKITHYSMTTNAATTTTVFNDWVPIAGWREH